MVLVIAVLPPGSTVGCRPQAAFPPALAMIARSAVLLYRERAKICGIPMTHRRAVALMVLVTLLWSIAGVVTRHLDSARSFEVTFWRSLFNAIALAIALRA